MRALLRTGMMTLATVLATAAWTPGAGAAPTDPGSDASAVVGPQSFPVTAALDGRTARKGGNHAAVDRYPAGSSVLVVCQDAGEPVRGSSVWDLTSDGLWIPDHFVRTGTAGFAPELPRCSGPRSYEATRTLDGRTQKRLANHAERDRYPAGSTVEVVCQAFGGPTYHGSFLWDRTVDGLWVPDAFVRTGTRGLVSGVPRCDLDAPPVGRSTTAARLRGSDLQFSAAGAAFVAAYEGYRATAYDDAGGHCTIGYGHLIHRGRCSTQDARRWGSLDRDRAVALLWQDAETYAAGVRTALPDTPLAQHEFDALVSLSYNIGNGGFRSSSVRSRLAQDRPDYAAVPAMMLRWVSSSGITLPGLQRRRVNEGQLFRTGSYEIVSARDFSRY
jgi:GH24 family phage-related lysozyme (muramidase)